MQIYTSEYESKRKSDVDDAIIRKAGIDGKTENDQRNDNRIKGE